MRLSSLVAHRQQLRLVVFAYLKLTPDFRQFFAGYCGIGNARRDYLHEATTTISQNHAMVRSMSKSAAGTTEQPGRNVRAKSGLNKTILDQGCFESRRQLDYKLAWAGGHLIAVPPQESPAFKRGRMSNTQNQRRMI